MCEATIPLSLPTYIAYLPSYLPTYQTTTDVADAVFFDDLRHRFPAVDALLTHRYQRFIGISNKCELDIVPRLVDRVG